MLKSPAARTLRSARPTLASIFAKCNDPGAQRLERVQCLDDCEVGGRYERSAVGGSGDRAEIAISGDGVLHVFWSTNSLTFVEFSPKYTIRMV